MSTVAKSQATAVLGAQELGPGNTRALRGGIEAGVFEDSPHGGGSNAVTEAR